MPKSTCLGLLIVALGLIAAAPADADAGQWTIGKYTIAIRATELGGISHSELTVSDGRKPVYRRRDAELWINPRGFFEDLGPDAAYEEQQRPYRVGEDVLGLGAPSLIVQSFSGGAHCCFTLTVLLLGDQFRALPKIELQDAEFVRVKKVPGRDALVLATSDDTFAYWRAPFALSSAGSVTLSFDAAAGRYVADADLMRAPLPPPAKLEELRAKAHDAQQKEIAENSGIVPPDLTQPLLDLIYTGHLAEARAFVDGAWAGSAGDRDDYWRELTRCQLRRSPYWPTLARMNGLAPDKAPAHCPRA